MDSVLYNVSFLLCFAQKPISYRVNSWQIVFKRRDQNKDAILLVVFFYSSHQNFLGRPTSSFSFLYSCTTKLQLKEGLKFHFHLSKNSFIIYPLEASFCRPNALQHKPRPCIKLRLMYKLNVDAFLPSLIKQ